jgi:hypothetical protein
MKHSVFRVAACALILLLPLGTLPVHGEDQQQSNFQIAPSPIAYPYFEDGRFDGKLDASFVSMTMKDMSMAGAVLGGKGRIAFANFIAIDGDLGLTAMGGTMQNVPVAYSPPPYYPVDVKDASLFLGSLRMSVNLEIQPIHTGFGSIILFGGPNFNLSQFNITTQYSLERTVPSYEKVTGFTQTTQTISTTTGLQGGVQLEISLSDALRLSPFVMISSFSGTSTYYLDVGQKGVETTSGSYDIPSTTSMSIGLDIIIGDISIGTVLQQLQSQEQSSEDVKVIMISVGYHFSGGISEKSGEGEASESLRL